MISCYLPSFLLRLLSKKRLLTKRICFQKPGPTTLKMIPMTTKKLHTAPENYELLKLNRIQSFNHRSLFHLKKGIVFLLVAIAVVLQIIIAGS
jgi:hypothetical protein